MTKKTNKSSKETKELDIILEQLKQSFNSESSNELQENKSNDTDYYEKDDELNSILGKIFSSESQSITNKSKEEQKIAITEKEDTIDLLSDSNNKNITESSTLTKDISNVASEQTKEDTIKIEEDAYNEETVNSDVLEILSDSLNKKQKDAEPSVDYCNDDSPDLEAYTDNQESVDSAESIREQYTEQPSNTISLDTTAQELYDVSNDDIIVTDDSDDLDSKLFLLDIPEESIEEDELLLNDTQETVLNSVDTTDFVVEDEEFECCDIHSDESEIQQQPTTNIILSPDRYIDDPLQEKLLGFFSKTQSEKAVNCTETVNFDIDNPANSTPDLELDNNDISLLLKFGYDDEVKNHIGEEKTQNLLFEKDTEFIWDKMKKPFGFCGKEYHSQEQIPEIKAKYKSQKNAQIVLLSIISALFLSILSINIFFEFISNKSNYLVFLIIEFVLIVLIVMSMHQRIYYGFLGIIRFEINKYSVLCSVFLIYCIYNIINLFVFSKYQTSIKHSDLMLFGSCVSLYAVIIAATDLLRCIKELSIFNLLTSNGTIFTAEKQKTISNLQMEATPSQNPYDQNSYRICETAIISGYFRKISQQNNEVNNSIFLLGFVPFIALLLGCSCYLATGNILFGTSMSMITSLLCIPLISLCMHEIFDSIATKKMIKNKIAFIGAEETEELSKAKSIIFKDADAIEIVSLIEIHPNKNAEIKKTMSIAKSVFSALGGPMSRAIPASEESQNIQHDVIINSITDNGVDIYFDSSINILIGDKHYMRNHNIKVKTDSNLSTASKGVDRAVVYMAFNGIPKLGFIINSRIKTRFINAVTALKNENINTIVETYEPQINDLYFEQNQDSEAIQTIVRKCTEYESPFRKPICDGSIISPESRLTIAENIYLSKKIIAQKNYNNRIITATILFGLIISVLFTMLLFIPNSQIIIQLFKSHFPFVSILIMLICSIPAIVSLIRMKHFNKK